MQKNIFILFLAAVLSVFTFAACGETETDATETDMDMEEVVEEEPETPANSIVDIAISSPDHSTLVSALQAAGLVETLQGDGPFTVFAPTNDAFAALPAGTVDNLLKPENEEMLTSILTYHVVSGSVMAGDLSDGQTITTLQGDELTVSIENGTVMINEATVTTPNLEGSNGVIHVIDGVLMPAN